MRLAARLSEMEIKYIEAGKSTNDKRNELSELSNIPFRAFEFIREARERFTIVSTRLKSSLSDDSSEMELMYKRREESLLKRITALEDKIEKLTDEL